MKPRDPPPGWNPTSEVTILKNELVLDQSEFEGSVTTETTVETIIKTPSDLNAEKVLQIQRS